MKMKLKEDLRIFYAGVAQLAECNLAKVEVAGSNPVTRFHFVSEIK